ncbi:MAG TPA: hypothetical protein VFP37_05475 [Steroidobacteraceae bacterium]|nr:hypothetical protein [Steroidobacteraceae bacterium]
MTTAILFLLAGVCAYLGIRLHAANVENSALRTSIVQLKRRLNQRSS